VSYQALSLGVEQRGVTLLELLVAVAVLGILAAIAVPYYGDYIQRQRLVGAAEAVYGQMQLAKRAAISNNKTVYFLASGFGGTGWCATYSESSVISSSCDNGYVVSSSANPSVRVRSEDYPGVTLSDFSGGSAVIGFVMPGVSVDSSDAVQLSVGSANLGDLRVGVSAGMQVSICTTNGLGQYPDC